MCRTRALLCLLLAGSALRSYAEDLPIVTVLDFQVDQLSMNDMRTLVSLFSSALFQTKRYTVIDVSERDRLLQELDFSSSECAEESCQLEIGRLLAAEYIVVGRVGQIGKKHVVTVKYWRRPARERWAQRMGRTPRWTSSWTISRGW